MQQFVDVRISGFVDFGIASSLFGVVQVPLLYV